MSVGYVYGYVCLGMESKTNAFLSPRWGSFLVYNVEVPENVTLPYSHEMDMRNLFQILLPQIKLLIGIQPQVSSVMSYEFVDGNLMITSFKL